MEKEDYAVDPREGSTQSAWARRRSEQRYSKTSCVSQSYEDLKRNSSLTDAYDMEKQELSMRNEGR